MVKRREKMKKDELQLNIDVYEKRYQAKDFAGQLLAEYTAVTTKSRYTPSSLIKLQSKITFSSSLPIFRPAFAPLYSNQYYHHTTSNLASHSNQWNSSQSYSSGAHLNHHLQNKRDFDGMSTSSSRKEKRQYKKRHKPQREKVIKQGWKAFKSNKFFILYQISSSFIAETYDGIFSSDDEDLSTQLGASESEDEGIYPFRRNRNCNYFKVMIISVCL
jgi:hypothetical protein